MGGWEVIWGGWYGALLVAWVCVEVEMGALCGEMLC